MNQKVLFSLIGLICLLTIGCEHTGVDYGRFITDPRKDTFRNMKVYIALDKSNYQQDTTITIKTSCQALFNGKGRIILYDGINGENCYEVLSPVQRKVCKQDDSESDYTFMFDANQTATVDWKVKIELELDYTTFYALAILDSIIIKDSCDLFIPEYGCKQALEEYRELNTTQPLRARSESITLSL